MPTRSNACSELTCFWLEARLGCLITEGVPVAVPYALSDIDFVATHPQSQKVKLPGGACVGPRLLIETKDEHDWEPSGREFGAILRADVERPTALRNTLVGDLFHLLVGFCGLSRSPDQAIGA